MLFLQLTPSFIILPKALMATPTSIPSDITDADKALVSHYHDAFLNSTILYSFLNGEYVQTWHICV